MRLSAADRAFIARRERRVRHWPYAGVAALALIGAYAVWMWLKTPRLINPWVVIEDIQSGTLSESSMGVMAMMLPLVVDALLVLMLCVLLLWSAQFSNERRLIRLLRRLEADSGDGDSSGSS